MEEKRSCKKCKYAKFVQGECVLACGYTCYLTTRPRAFGLTRNCVYNDEVFKKLEAVKKKKRLEETKIFLKGFFIGIVTVIIIVAIIGAIWLLF